MAYDNPYDENTNQITDPNNPEGNYPPGVMPPPATPPPPPPTTTSSAYNPQMRDRIVRGWVGSSFGANRQGIEQYLQSLGADAQGWRVDRDDKVYDPSGRVYDWIGNVNTANAQKRTGYTTDSRYANVTGSKKGSSNSRNTAPTAVSGGAAGGAGGGAPARDPRWDDLYNQLLQRSQQSLAIDRNDPIIRAQADAYGAQEERARRDYISNLSEKSGPNANLRGEQRMAAESLGQNVGGFEAQLMGRELTARRDEISQALASRQGMLSFEQQQALTKELALIDDATRRLSINNQHNQFGRDLDYRNRALQQNDNQFQDRLGFDYGDRSNYWDAVNRGLF